MAGDMISAAASFSRMSLLRRFTALVGLVSMTGVGGPLNTAPAATSDSPILATNGGGTI